MIPKFRIHGDGAELVPYTVPELFFFAGGRTLCFDAAREGDAIGHWHDEIELLYVTEGSMVYSVNGTRWGFLSTRGSCIFLKKAVAPTDACCCTP